MTDFMFAADLIQRIINKIHEIKTLPKDCHKLSEIIIKLKPIYNDLSNQFTNNNHRQVVEILKNALITAEHIIDYIIEHPNYTKLRSGICTSLCVCVYTRIIMYM